MPSIACGVHDLCRRKDGARGAMNERRRRLAGDPSLHRSRYAALNDAAQADDCSDTHKGPQRVNMAPNVFVGLSAEYLCPPSPPLQSMSREPPLDRGLDISRVGRVPALHDVTLREISNEPGSGLPRSRIAACSNLYQPTYLIDDYIKLHVQCSPRSPLRWPRQASARLSFEIFADGVARTICTCYEWKWPGSPP